ncbi:MAG: metallophosphoesterase [Anaerolineales bacterium]|jgi:tartrate-resistant acid phosphatase type 5
MSLKISPVKMGVLIGVFFLIVLTACATTLATPTLIPTKMARPTFTLGPTTDPTQPPLETAATTDTAILTSPTPTATLTPTPEPVRFAVIGDYGNGEQSEADVAELVKSWNPDFIITTGDNNYASGEASTIDENIGQFYHQFIYPYQGTYGAGAEANRLFPSLGNHDWYTAGAQPYLDYFELPGNERYYDFEWGPVHLFALDGDPNEPDGVGASSDQAAWLQSRLADSTAPWKIVYNHFPPFSSGPHGNTDWIQWPFQEWGATAVLAGHDHTYERLLVDGLPYFVNGLGGAAKYNFESPVPGSQIRYNADFGAMLIEASEESLTFQFINRKGEVIDTYDLTRKRLNYSQYIPVIQNEAQVSLAQR